MRKLRKFVTLGDYHPSIHIEGVVTPHDFFPFIFHVSVGGRNHPPSPPFWFSGGGGIPNFFHSACQKTGGPSLLRSMGGRRFLRPLVAQPSPLLESGEGAPSWEKK